MSKRTRRPRLPEPVGQVTIESLSHDGRGVAHVAGKAVFIEGGLPGETVGFEYLATHRNFDEGRVTAIRQASPDRVEPRCPHFGVCGGCSLQHLEAGAQIRAKQQTLLDNLERLGGVVPATVLPPLTGPVWGYRGKARLGVKYVNKKGRVVVGFRERRAPYVADLTRCEVLHPSVGTRLGDLAALVGGLAARARIPQIEVAVGGAVTALVFRHLEPLDAADLARLQDFARVQGIHVYLQPAGPDSVHALAPADSVLTYRLPEQDVELRFLPNDFTQVNDAINRSMVARVLELLAPEPEDGVLDLYCGLGNFTLPLARLAGSVTGIEGEAGLVSRARDNARRNGLDNVSFHVADLDGDQRQAAWAGVAYSKILLDPPRSGAAAVLDVIGNIHPRRLVYVSCHPGSLARDAGILVRKHRYRLAAAGVMDMFPHTAHVESIALFESG
ncbi:MAG: 23S rRNA (uracil(1939)-C(5))-methyltransferase RlmD [Pseudomonadota bacterium]